MTKPLDLSVLLVTYNSRAFIGDCIRAVRDTVTDHSVEIIAADNASTDGTLGYLRSEFPTVRVIDMGANTGFSRGNNAAMAVANGRNIVLLNGDAIVQPGALDSLVRFLDEHPHAGVAAPQLLNPDGTDQRTARSFPTPAAALFGRRSPLTRWFPDNRWSKRFLSGADPVTDDPYEVDWVSGACLMVPRAVVDAVGPLDAGFFMHWEDADWCRRIKDAGHGVYCVPKAKVVHDEGGSRRGWPPVQVRYFHHGAYRYYAKHHLAGSRRPLRPIAATALGARAGFVIVRDSAMQRARASRSTPTDPRTDAGSGGQVTPEPAVARAGR